MSRQASGSKGSKPQSNHRSVGRMQTSRRQMKAQQKSMRSESGQPLWIGDQDLPLLKS